MTTQTTGNKLLRAKPIGSVDGRGVGNLGSIPRRGRHTFPIPSHAPTSVRDIPVLTLALRAQPHESTRIDSVRVDSKQARSVIEKRFLSRMSRKSPYPFEGNGTLDLEWVDSNWDDFK